MKFFELADKLKRTPEELSEWLKSSRIYQDQKALLPAELTGKEIDPFVEMSSSVEVLIIKEFARSTKASIERSAVNALGISHFKAFGSAEQAILVKPLTFIFGPNSAGKSSLLHSLLWAEDAFHSGKLDVIRPRLAGDMVDLGGIGNVVHRKGADGNTFSLRYSFAPDQLSQALKAAIGESKAIHLELTVDAGPLRGDSSLEPTFELLNAEGELMEGFAEEACITRYAVYIGDEEKPLLRLSKRRGGHFVVNNFETHHPDFFKQWESAKRGFTFSNEFTIFEEAAIYELLYSAIGEMVVETKRVLPERAFYAGPPLNASDAIAEVSKVSEPGFSDSAPQYEAGDVVENYAAHFEDDEYEPEQHDYIAEPTEPEEPEIEIPSIAEIEEDDYSSIKLEEAAGAVQLYVESTINTLVAECTNMLLKYLRNIIYLGSQRAYPERGFSFTSKRDADWHANGGEAWDLLTKDAQLRDRVNTWMQDEKHLKAPYKLAMRKFVDVENASSQIQEALDAHYNQAIKGEINLDEYTYNDSDEEGDSSVELLPPAI